MAVTRVGIYIALALFLLLNYSCKVRKNDARPQSNSDANGQEADPDLANFRIMQPTPEDLKSDDGTSGYVGFVPEQEGLAAANGGGAGNPAKNNGDGFALDGNSAQTNPLDEANYALESHESFQGRMSQFNKSPVMKSLTAQMIFGLLDQFKGETSADRLKNAKSFFAVVDAKTDVKADVKSENNSKPEASGAASPLEFLKRNVKSITDSSKLEIMKSSILGNSREEKLALLEKLEAKFSTTSSGFVETMKSRYNFERIKPLLLKLAGRDGYLNYADATRILPAVPLLVSEIADKEIAEGLAQGMAQGRAEIEARRGPEIQNGLNNLRGLKGRVVRNIAAGRGLLVRLMPGLQNEVYSVANAKYDAAANQIFAQKINEGLSKAYQEKWAALQQAGVKSNNTFIELMEKFGVGNFYTASVYQHDYADPDPGFTSQDMRDFAAALNISLDPSSISGSTGGAADISSLIPSFVDDLVFPQGIPVATMIKLLEAQSRGESTLPTDLMFRNTVDGKIAVMQKRTPCLCEFSNKGYCTISFKIDNNPNFEKDSYYVQKSKEPMQCSPSACQAVFSNPENNINLMNVCSGNYIFDNKIYFNRAEYSPYRTIVAESAISSNVSSSPATKPTEVPVTPPATTNGKCTYKMEGTLCAVYTDPQSKCSFFGVDASRCNLKSLMESYGTYMRQSCSVCL